MTVIVNREKNEEFDGSFSLCVPDHRTLVSLIENDFSSQLPKCLFFF